MSIAKTEKIPESYADSVYRWVQYALNPMGDPEMPIFTTTPSLYPAVTAYLINSQLKLQTTVEGSNITISDVTDAEPKIIGLDRGADRISATLDNTKYNVCLTKRNYTPKLFSILNLGSKIIQDYSQNADRIYIGFGDKDNPNTSTTLKGKVDIEAKDAVYIHTNVVISADSDINIKF